MQPSVFRINRFLQRISLAGNQALISGRQAAVSMVDYKVVSAEDVHSE